MDNSAGAHSRRTRGRPRGARAALPRYPNNLAKLRSRRGLTQDEVAAAAGISAGYYGELELGYKRLNTDLARSLSGVLRCSVGDLFPTTPAISIALSLLIAAQESAERPEDYDLAQPAAWIQAPPRLARPDECFAAEVLDDSADLDYPRHSILFVRRREALRDPLPLGSKIVARFWTAPLAAGRCEPPTREILYGILDRSLTGDILLMTRQRTHGTSPRRLPASLLIRPGSARLRHIDEHYLAMIPREALADPEPRPGDEAAILGIVAWSSRPE
jgi:transcriptional regulator with XRE-family HTH domain